MLTNRPLNARKSLLTDRRGAVLPEFAIVLMPLLLCFFCFMQIAFVACAKMAVRHAAYTAVRAAVISHGAFHDGPRERNDGLARKAADEALGPWKGVINVKSVLIQDAAGGGIYDEKKVTVDATYTCSVAIGLRIVCNDGSLPMNESAHMANQGASYIR